MWHTLLAQAEGGKSSCASGKGSTRTTASLLPAPGPRDEGPLSQKRAAEGLQGRVRRARVYVLSLAAGAARRSTPSSSGPEPP